MVASASNSAQKPKSPAKAAAANIWESIKSDAFLDMLLSKATAVPLPESLDISEKSPTQSIVSDSDALVNHALNSDTEQKLFGVFVKFCNYGNESPVRIKNQKCATPNKCTNSKCSCRALQLIDCGNLVKLLREKALIDDLHVKQRDVESLFHTNKTKYERKINFKTFKKILFHIASRFYPLAPDAEAFELCVEKIVGKFGAASPARSQKVVTRGSGAEKSESVFDRLSDAKKFPFAYQKHYEAASHESVSPVKKSPTTLKKHEDGPSVFERLSNVNYFVGIHRKNALSRMQQQHHQQQQAHSSQLQRTIELF